MNTQIILRKYRKEDEASLTGIIREAWHYDELCTPKTAAKLAKVFLYSCLANQTYTQVAEIDEKAAGVIMAKDIRSHRCPFAFRIRQVLSVISLFLSREGRQAARIFRNVSGIDKALSERSRNDYEGEVAFFAVAPEYRGRHIGTLLFEQMLSYMKKEAIRRFYLYTDTSCNYGFYESHGMKRAAEEKETFTIKGKQEEMTFFLYDCHCA